MTPCQSYPGWGGTSVLSWLGSCPGQGGTPGLSWLWWRGGVPQFCPGCGGGVVYHSPVLAVVEGGVTQSCPGCGGGVGYPSSVLAGGIVHSCTGGGIPQSCPGWGYPSPILAEGIPESCPCGRIPSPGSWPGGTPVLSWLVGIPLARTGVPPQPGLVYPWKEHGTRGWGTPQKGHGTRGWGTPQKGPGTRDLAKNTPPPYVNRDIPVKT